MEATNEEQMGRQPICETYSNGTKEWFLDSKRHRTDGPAVEWPHGYKAWWVDGKRHRTDGPAIERPDGSKQWWVDGKRHRTDGPAIEDSDGSKQWWLDDKKVPWQTLYHQATTDEARLSILIAALTTS